MIQVFLEVAAGSHAKNRYDERTLEYKGTRHISHPYPYPYGFIIGTSSDDGEAVDCYLITKDKLEPGNIVECEPFGMLEQFEGDEIDHKVLAALPGQQVNITPELQKEIQDFIYSIFRDHPEVQIRVGDILPKETALHHIQSHQEA